ncbi:DNA replication/repair protein RecF [Sphingopyxis sp. XHP0097]|uniref:DNA replication and repair protein RecF n=1 Tax=Sphingopyxis jiangsuensis TaxID=2871171 RepID=A0ABS7MBP2_9SPHN|nr:MULTISPECIES: DNA replication/repair protein RecF [Sphingopyxis]MBY4636228.1 DNA replication/repair protein RecF [Sphingopyxis jiangsuensis]
MTLTRLSLTDFRNHAGADFAAGSGLVAIHGDNGVGKTNILEAISLLAPGRGLRRAPLAEMVRDGAGGGFAVFAEVQAGADLPHVALGTGIEPAQPGRRIVRINGAPAAATALGDWLAVLWLTPAMDRLFVETAGNRRRFLDRLVLALEPRHAQHGNRYEAALRARGKLLADAAQADAQWLASLEAQLAEHGAAIDAARQRTLAALSAELAEQPDAPFARPLLTLVDAEGQARAAPWAMEELRRLFAERRRIDAAAGRATAGPHRDDLAAVHAVSGRAAARCSTGEQKAMLLSLVLAHSDLVARLRGQRPVLLLDEVAAHLDPSRRAALYARLAGQGGQAWLTGTEAALFDDMPGPVTRFRIADGRVLTG